MLRPEHMSTYLEKRSKHLTRGILLAVMLGLTVTVGLTGRASAQEEEGVWVTLAPMPFPDGASVVRGGAIGGQLFALGILSTGVSIGTNFNRAYDSGTDSWASKAPDPGGGGRGRCVQAVGVINGLLYVAGGWEGCDGNLPTNQLTVYDPTTDTWTTKTGMPTARGDARAGVIDGKLFVVGGKPTCCAASQLATLEVYDPISDTWSTKASMPTARAGPAVGVIDGKLYVVGGECDGLAVCGGKTVTAVLEVYDPATDTWTTKTPMPVATSTADAGVLDGKLHVVGLAPSGSTFVAFHEVYDPETDTWTTAALMPTPRQSVLAAVIDDQLFVVGGALVSGGATGVNEVFTPED